MKEMMKRRNETVKGKREKGGLGLSGLDCMYGRIRQKIMRKRIDHSERLFLLIRIPIFEGREYLLERLIGKWCHPLDSETRINTGHAWDRRVILF